MMLGNVARFNNRQYRQAYGSICLYVIDIEAAAKVERIQ